MFLSFFFFLHIVIFNSQRSHQHEGWWRERKVIARCVNALCVRCHAWFWIWFVHCLSLKPLEIVLKIFPTIIPPVLVNQGIVSVHEIDTFFIRNVFSIHTNYWSLCHFCWFAGIWERYLLVPRGLYTFVRNVVWTLPDASPSSAGRAASHYPMRLYRLSQKYYNRTLASITFKIVNQSKICFRILKL